MTLLAVVESTARATADFDEHLCPIHLCGDFYSFVLFNDGTDEWYCGGIERGQSLNDEQLSRALA